jgi:EAL domain-containing protein (putative c-di-GMP-specific phosphodiesterase class I)
MQALKAIGVRLSLDDFGTGYSSLNYLRHFPIDTLKIDRSFVNDIASDAGAANICRSVITIGHELGMRVLAEGVETSEQVDYLQRNGCDAYQGYWFGRPVPAEEAERLLRARDRGERLDRGAASAANP